MDVSRKRMRCAVTLVMLACVSCSPLLLYSVDIPEFVAPPDSALCVFYSADGNSDEDVRIYMDRAPVAGLNQRTVTTTTVPPGKHFIYIVHGSDFMYEIDFKPGKAYFFSVGTIETPVFDGVVTNLVPPQEARTVMHDYGGRLQFTRLNPEHDEPYIDEDDWEDELEDYQDWRERNPDDASRMDNYPGY